MIRCASCQVENEDNSDNCIACGKGLYALTRGSVVSGRYEILDSIGKGGMGVVYKARDLELDEIVALKVMRGDLTGSSEGSRRFRSEIKLARKVSHANVCRIHDYGRQGHLTYIVMEFIAGTDLKHEVRRRGGFEPAEALDLILQVASGLEAVHRQGVVHRDLKTPNIMRMGDGTAKLMDFGIAKAFGGDAETGATATGLIVGTPEYMSPEQARAEAVDARSDIYALGIVLFELLTGELPFRGETPMVTLFKHMQEPPPLDGPRAARIPPVVTPVLRKALAKDAADRYATVQEMAAELERARALLGVRGVPPAPLTSSRPVGPTPAAAFAGGPLAAARQPALDLDATTPMPTPVPTAAPTAVPTPMPASRAAVAPTPRPIVRQATPPAPRPAPAQAPAPPPQRPLRANTPPPAPAARSAAPVAARAEAASRYQPSPRRGLPWIVWAGVGAVVVAVGVGVALMARWGAEPEAATAALRPNPSPETSGSAAASARASTPAAASPRVEPTPNAASPTAALGSGPSAVSTPRPAPSAPALTQAPRPTPPPRVEPLPTAPPPTLALRPYPGPSPRAETVSPTAGAGPATPITASSPAPATGPAASAAPEGTGTLRIGVKPYAEVFVDGKSVGTTPLGVLTLASGPHTIRLVHPDFQPLQRKVTIRAGESPSLTVDLALDGIPK